MFCSNLFLPALHTHTLFNSSYFGLSEERTMQMQAARSGNY